MSLRRAADRSAHASCRFYGGRVDIRTMRYGEIDLRYLRCAELNVFGRTAGVAYKVTQVVARQFSRHSVGLVNARRTLQVVVKP